MASQFSFKSNILISRWTCMQKGTVKDSTEQLRPFFCPVYKILTLQIFASTFKKVHICVCMAIKTICCKLKCPLQGHSNLFNIDPYPPYSGVPWKAIQKKILNKINSQPPSISLWKIQAVAWKNTSECRVGRIYPWDLP